MPGYAQTYLQLHNQLDELEYSHEELNDIQCSYRLAIVLFAGFFQSNGKEFLSHVVRTASILASVKASPKVVAAGLLHNGYARGDFGDGQSGFTPARKERVIRVVGKDTERLLYGFHTMDWSPNIFHSIRDQLPQYDGTKRTVVLLRLADHLEHNLDYGTVYYSDIERTFRMNNIDILADMAEMLGFLSLAKVYRQVYQVNSTYEVVSEFRPTEGVKSGSTLAPKSCHKRFTVIMKEWWRQWLRGIRWILLGLTRRACMRINTLKQRLNPF